MVGHQQMTFYEFPANFAGRLICVHVEEHHLVAAFSVGLLTAQDRMALMSNSYKTATTGEGMDKTHPNQNFQAVTNVCDYTRPQNPRVLFLNSDWTLCMRKGS